MAQHLHLPMIFSRVATHSLSCRRYILLKHTRQDCKNCNTRHNLLYNVIDASVFRWLCKQFFIIILLIVFFCGKYRKVESQVLARIALSTKVRSDYFSLVILKCFHSALMNRNYAHAQRNWKLIPYNIWQRCCSNATARENDSGVLPLLGNPWNV